MTIKMPVVVNVKCLDCGAKDVANWSKYGAEQPCLNCDAAPVSLVKI